MEDIEELVKAARAQIDCDRFYKENNDCAGCEMPYKENPPYQKMCVGFDLFVLPKIVEALERQKNSNEVLGAERNELHKNNCGLRAENERLRAELAAERAKYAELQRYNVDCTKACDRQMVEILELREQNAQFSESQRRERAAVERLAKIDALCVAFRDAGSTGLADMFARDVMEISGPGAGEGAAE